MNPTADQLLERGHDLAAASRLMPAIEAFEEARQATTSPVDRALASYNLGAYYWAHLGNGEAARREFHAVAEIFDEHGRGQFPSNLRVLQPNALENEMLCAVSFDEFEALAERLRVLAPNAPIVTRLVPEVHRARENGERWSARMMAIAEGYYNRSDPEHDVGRYGEALSTYQLLLLHRGDLRLSREEWHTATYECCALSIRMLSDCLIKRGGDDDPHSPEEFLPIVTDCLPLVEDYLAGNPGDDVVDGIRRKSEEFVSRIRQQWATRGGPDIKEMEKQRDVEALIRALSDEDEDVRVAAGEALGRMNDPRAVEPLIAELKDEDSVDRGLVALVLGHLVTEIGDRRVLEALIAALKDDDDTVRLGAAVGLGINGDTGAVLPLLNAMQADQIPEVRSRMDEALHRLVSRA